MNTINAAYENIKSAYLTRLGFIKVPSIQDLNEIRDHIQRIDWEGKSATLMGMGGLGISYIAWHVPHAGPLISLVAGTASLAALTFGRDRQVISRNLEREYVDKIPSASYYSWATTNQMTEHDFEIQFTAKANENTVYFKA